MWSCFLAATYIGSHILNFCTCVINIFGSTPFLKNHMLDVTRCANMACYAGRRIKLSRMKKFEDWNGCFWSSGTKLSFGWKFEDKIDYSICSSGPPLIFSLVLPLFSFLSLLKKKMKFLICLLQWLTTCLLTDQKGNINNEDRKTSQHS